MKPAGTLPDVLANMIADSLVALEHDPLCDLPYDSQLGIYFALQTPQIPSVVATKRRIGLDSSAARYVLPIWETLWPTDDRPQKMLSVADRLFTGTLDSQEAWAVWKEYSTYYREELLVQNTPGVLVYLASLKVLGLLAYPETIRWFSSYEETRSDIKNDELEPDEWTASYTASAACAPVLDRDTERRKRFWAWWLKEAVPNAYLAAS
jgi:hypothetical protein